MSVFAGLVWGFWGDETKSYSANFMKGFFWTLFAVIVIAAISGILF